MARVSRILVSVVIVAAIGVGAYLTRERWLGRLTGSSATSTAATGGRQGGGRRFGGGAGAQGPTSVLVASAKTADVPIYIDGIGSVKPLNSVLVRSQVSGQLVQVAFQQGQDVKKGDVLARIDDAIYRATLDQAIAKKAQDEAQLTNAKLDLDRYDRLAAAHSGTQQQADTQRMTVAQFDAQVKSDQASIESAQASLGYTVITAPIDGRTGIRNVDPGNLVSSSDTAGIVTISQIRPIYVAFSVPQQQLPKILQANGDGLEVDAMAGDGQSIIDRGKLAVVDNQIDTTTGTVKLQAQFPNDKLALWLGAFVNARLLVETLQGVVVVPTAAIQRGPNGAFVYLLKPGNSVAMQAVTIAQQDDVQAVIASGVSAGDSVVTTGFARLQDGAHVEIGQPPSADPATPPAADANTPPGRRRNADGSQGAGQGNGQRQGQGQGQHRRRNGNGQGGAPADAGAAPADAPPANAPATSPAP